MKLARRISVVTVLVVFSGSLLALQSNGYQFYGSGPYDPVTPEQSHEKAEFSWSRLRFTAVQRSSGGFGQGFGGTADTAMADDGPGAKTTPRPTGSSCWRCGG